MNYDAAVRALAAVWLLALSGCLCGPAKSKPQLAASPDALDFGALQPGTRGDRGLRLINSGGATLKISGARLDADARNAFSLGNLPTELAPDGGDATLSIFYAAPTAEGPDT